MVYSKTNWYILTKSDGMSIKNDANTIWYIACQTTAKTINKFLDKDIIHVFSELRQYRHTIYLFNNYIVFPQCQPKLHGHL